MPNNPIRIVIVEDHQLVAQSLGAWVSAQPDFLLVGCASTAEEGWNLCGSSRPDLVLCDIEMPGMDGLELATRLMEDRPEIRLLAMSGRMDPYTIWRVWQSGVHGYIEKIASPHTLLDALRTVAKGGTAFSPLFQKIKKEWLSQPQAFQKLLSKREQDVLRHVVAGWNDDRIAHQLGISSATVGVHRKHIRQKLELHNDRELVAYGRQWGLDSAEGA